MFRDDVARVVNAGTAWQTEQLGGLGGQVLPTDLAPEQGGGSEPDLLLRARLLLSQQVDHLGVEPPLDAVPPVREVLYL